MSRPVTAVAIALIVTTACAQPTSTGAPEDCPSYDPNEPVSSTDPPEPTVPAHCLPRDRGDDAVPMRVTCRAFYRPSVSDGHQERARAVVARDGDDETRSVGEFWFRVRYFDDAYEGRSIQTSAGLRGKERALVTELYQVDRTRKTANQFGGGHGFTGLVYVNHPASPAELQYFCRSA